MYRDMAPLPMFLVLLVTVSQLVYLEAKEDIARVDIVMPDVSPQVHDSYLCVPMKAGAVASYITGFLPHTNSSIAHHMLLYGCMQPFREDEVWTCGEMASKNSERAQGPVCSQGPKIIYAWAMDAKSLRLPEDVAFKVGGDSDIQWVVLQVHYKDVTPFLKPSTNTDASGITLLVSKESKPKRAGVYLMSTDGVIPPKSTTYMEVACDYLGDETIHPFAYRTHAHTHGEVSTGYRIRDGVWSEIGRMSPKVPEMFYNVTDPSITIEQGDTLAARCTMVNNENRTIKIGQTTNDEMCNFYIMYWMQGDHTLERPYCASPGPPRWSWASDPSLSLAGLPNTASVVPGTSTVLKASKTIAANGERTQQEVVSEIAASEADYPTGLNDNDNKEEDNDDKEEGGDDNDEDDYEMELPTESEQQELIDPEQEMDDLKSQDYTLTEDQQKLMMMLEAYDESIKLKEMEDENVNMAYEGQDLYDEHAGDPYEIYIP